MVSKNMHVQTLHFMYHIIHFDNKIYLLSIKSDFVINTDFKLPSNSRKAESN